MVEVNNAMTKLKTLLAQFAANRGGGTAIEYSIIAAGIASAIVAAIALTGTSVEALWTTVTNAF
ncbi:MAG: Flp family type IVb pilin [Pseudolabrys sp.]